MLMVKTSSAKNVEVLQNGQLFNYFFHKTLNSHFNSLSSKFFGRLTASVRRSAFIYTSYLGFGDENRWICGL